jgi:hypothetical protein
MIDVIADVIEPIVASLSGGPVFIYGEKAYQNLAGDDIDFTNGAAFLYTPLVERWKTPANTIRPYYQVEMFFAIKSEADMSPSQRRPGIMRMKAIAKEFVLRLQELEDNDGRKLISNITNVRPTEAINEYDVILDGVVLELEIEVIDYSSLCL